MSEVSECPVCFERYSQSAGSSKSPKVWPCGHAVCQGCFRDMVRNGLHRCPTCRMPPPGMTEQQASLAAQTAILAEQAREAAAANNGATTGVQSVLTHGGRNYEVIFFASQNSDSRPTDVLEAFAEQVAPGPRTRMAARRRREIADAVPFADGPPEALQGMDYNWITNEYYFEDDTNNHYTAGDILGRGDHDIAVLIRELLQPSPLNQFLQARSAVRSRQST